MTETERTSLARVLGNIEGTVAALGDKVDELGKRSEAGRERIYVRIEDLGTSMAHRLEGIDARIAAVERQATDAATTAALAKANLEKDVMPTINEVKNWKITGITIIGMVGIGGAALGAFVFWAWDIVVTKLGLH